MDSHPLYALYFGFGVSFQASLLENVGRDHKWGAGREWTASRRSHDVRSPFLPESETVSKVQSLEASYFSSNGGSETLKPRLVDQKHIVVMVGIVVARRSRNGCAR
jgi:hypothetical protein